ncbi:hypothetical protein P9852_14675, partial [Geobacillus stearothermophilus]|nr:hypothetical protein [Geobacillus stearothermophilus]
FLSGGFSHGSEYFWQCDEDYVICICPWMILIWQRHAISLLVLSFYRISLNKKRRHERFLPVSKIGARPFPPINRLLMRVPSHRALFRKTKYSYIKHQIPPVSRLP